MSKRMKPAPYRFDSDYSTPPPFRVCPDCDGEAKNEGLHGAHCTCHGTGRIPIWYTIERWEELTGRKVPDDMPVWKIIYGNEDFYFLETWIDAKALNEGIIVIATEAGSPPKDWRPE